MRLTSFPRTRSSNCVSLKNTFVILGLKHPTNTYKCFHFTIKLWLPVQKRKKEKNISSTETWKWLQFESKNAIGWFLSHKMLEEQRDFLANEPQTSKYLNIFNMCCYLRQCFEKYINETNLTCGSSTGYRLYYCSRFTYQKYFPTWLLFL